MTPRKRGRPPSTENRRKGTAAAANVLIERLGTSPREAVITALRERPNEGLESIERAARDLRSEGRVIHHSPGLVDAVLKSREQHRAQHVERIRAALLDIDELGPIRKSNCVA